jgi:hypothetical protein
VRTLVSAIVPQSARSATLIAAVTIAGLVISSRAQTPAAEDRTFVASWSATGHRHVLPTESGRAAGVAHLSGAVVLTTSVSGLSTAFHAEAIAFDDGSQLRAGRAVWTDARGHQVFSVLRGEPLAKQRRILGTIAGGTGRYAGISGEYQLTWQYVFDNEDGSFQGRAVDLKGHFRVGSGGSP